MTLLKAHITIKQQISKNRFQKQRNKKQQVNNILLPNTTDSKKQQILTNNKYLKTIPNSNQKRNRKKPKIKKKLFSKNNRFQNKP